jgi:hypothetical protein
MNGKHPNPQTSSFILDLNPTQYQRQLLVHPNLLNNVINLSKLLKNDNQTMSTVNTVWSSSQNKISKLNLDSRHQFSLTHESRMDQLETLLSTNIQEINNQSQITEKSSMYLQLKWTQSMQPYRNFPMA